MSLVWQAIQYLVWKVPREWPDDQIRKDTEVEIKLLRL